MIQDPPCSRLDVYFHPLQQNPKQTFQKHVSADPSPNGGRRRAPGHPRNLN